MNDWLLQEDLALKKMLQGMTVSDDRKPVREVGVWFGHPDLEIRAQSYPYITINFVGMSEANERVERGRHVYGATVPNGWVPPAPEGATYIGELPTPVNLDYQISTWARNPRHDRQIMQQLLVTHAPLRGGWLDVDDGTRRRLDTMAFSKRDTVEGDKRLFSGVLMCRVSSEVPYFDSVALRTRAKSVSVALGTTADPAMEIIPIAAPTREEE